MEFYAGFVTGVGASFLMIALTLLAIAIGGVRATRRQAATRQSAGVAKPIERAS